MNLSPSASNLIAVASCPLVMAPFNFNALAFLAVIKFHNLTVESAPTETATLPDGWMATS